MSVKVKNPINNIVVSKVRSAAIPTDLSYLNNTEYGQEMMRLVAEIAEEQGTRTTEEINHLLELMRGSSVNADLS